MPAGGCAPPTGYRPVDRRGLGARGADQRPGASASALTMKVHRIASRRRRSTAGAEQDLILGPDGLVGIGGEDTGRCPQAQAHSADWESPVGAARVAAVTVSPRKVTPSAKERAWHLPVLRLQAQGLQLVGGPVEHGFCFGAAGGSPRSGGGGELLAPGEQQWRPADAVGEVQHEAAAVTGEASGEAEQPQPQPFGFQRRAGWRGRPAAGSRRVGRRPARPARTRAGSG